MDKRRAEDACINSQPLPTGEKFALWWVLTWALLSLCVCAESLLSCPTLYDPTERSPPGSSVRGILQARILERVVMPSSMGSSRPRDWTHVNYVSCIGRGVLFFFFQFYLFIFSTVYFIHLFFYTNTTFYLFISLFFLVVFVIHRHVSGAFFTSSTTWGAILSLWISLSELPACLEFKRAANTRRLSTTGANVLRGSQEVYVEGWVSFIRAACRTRMRALTTLC